MLTVAMIKDDLLKIIEGVRNPPALANFMPGLPYTRGRFTDLITKCIDLHRRLSLLPEGADTSMESQELFAIEAQYKRLRAKLLLMPAVFVLYVGFFGLFALITYIDIAGFVKDVLKVDAPERLITFGIAGAFLYLATAVLATLNHGGVTKDAVTKVADFTVRVLLAVVVPIVLVALFFTDEGKVREIQLSPELLAFACGYSAKLVVDLFNKIVEKGSKMIDAL
jgi:hypothetical protein